MATNIRELANTISIKYGNNFSSEQYLDKFIDERLILPKVDIDSYLLTFDDIDICDKRYISTVVRNFIEQNHLSLREIKRYLEYMKHFINCIHDFDSGCSYKMISKIVILPYLVGLYVLSPTKYKKFLNGEYFYEFKNFIENDATLIRFCKKQLFKSNNLNNVSDKDLINELEKIYNFLFKNKNQSTIKINNEEIYISEFEDILNNISLLGDLAKF